MKTAVITGPTGAVGIATVEALASRGVNCFAVVRPDSDRKFRIKESEFVHRVECNLDDLDRLPELIQTKVDVFYHFAWAGTFGNTRNDVYLQNQNITYSLKAVDVAEKLGCECFIGAGSQAEYGRFEGSLNEKVPTFPENGYGIAKLAAGQLTRISCEQKGMRHIWTRILSIYGPFDGMRTMVMSTIEKLLDGEKPSCTAGEQLWDYLYAKDVGKAFYLLGEKGKHGKIYCLGSGEAHPLKEYILAIRDEAAPGAEVGFGEIPYGEKQVMHLVADITDLKADTGFEPDYTFAEGIKETVEWVRQSRGLK